MTKLSVILLIACVCVVYGFICGLRDFHLQSSPFSKEKQRTSVRAMDEFRDWFEAPMKENWDVHYEGLLDYCRHYRRLPSSSYVTGEVGREGLNIGRWCKTQQTRYKGIGVGSILPLSDAQKSKLMVIDEFRTWAINPSTDAERWDLMYQALVAYCQQNKQLPPKNLRIANYRGHNDVPIGPWLSLQKQRYLGILGMHPLTRKQRDKFMDIDEFRVWTEGNKLLSTANISLNSPLSYDPLNDFLANPHFQTMTKTIITNTYVARRS